MLTARWWRSIVAVWILLICAPFGNLAAMPLFVWLLYRQWVVGVIKIPFAPESATAASEDNADTKILDISFCKLVDTYCVFNLASAMLQAAVAY